MRILIVDDDMATRALLKRKLAAANDVRVAATVQEGLTAAYAYSPDVVLLDVLFAGQAEGVDALRAFRSVVPEAEVVMMTAQYSPQDEARAIAIGAIAYVEKGDDRVIQKLVKIAGRVSQKQRAS